MDIKLANLEATEKFGIKLGKFLQPGDILCLNGHLGAGKTTLSKSIGLGLDVKDYITSPTFTLINEYTGRIPMYHFDVYRLENAHELDDLGFDDYFYGNGASIIEWAEKIENTLPKDRMVININRGSNDNERILTISGFGNRYDQLIKELEVN